MDVRDQGGQTALHAACLAGDLEIAELVLQKTGDKHCRDNR